MATENTNPKDPSDPHDLAHFTATGRPMPPSSQTTMGGYAMSDGAFTLYNSNTLPFKFNDSNFISVAIPQSEIDDVLGPGDAKTPADTDSLAASESPLITDSGGRRKSFLGGVFGKSKSGGGADDAKKGKKGAFRMVKITRGEYLRYFAKGEKGEYIGTAPEGDPGRKEVLRVRLADEGLQGRGRQDTRGVDFKGKKGFGNVFATGMASSMMGT